jgi:hypothetical protein
MCPVFASARLAKGGRTQPMSLQDPMLWALDAPGNRLDDFPPGTFIVLAFCDACGHRAPLDRKRVPADVTLQSLRGRRQCPAAGLHQTQVRIVYTGAGGFQYHQEETDGSAGA